MFKSVAQSLKIANKLRNDEPKKSEAERERKASKNWLNRLASATGESQEDKSCTNKEPLTDEFESEPRQRDEGFLVRQSRKKFSKFVARLQNVKRISSKPLKLRSDGARVKHGKGIKDKVVKFKLNNEDYLGENNLDSAHDYEDDSDDDDAYVSASDTFDDEYEFDEAVRAHCKQQEEQTKAKCKNGETSKKFDDDPGDKLVLPEELCDIPTFKYTQNCPKDIIDETRRLLMERYKNNPESFYDSDYKRMLADDWTVTRFLLRRRQDPKRTAKLMEECGKFRKEYKMGEVQLRDFPIEFHIPGGLFKYEPDLVGNVTMYMRIKMYRRVPEISDVFKAFILCVLEQCDVQCDGRGTAVVFDLTGCGLQNVDLGFLYWLLNSFRNYCPKGVSYILVYNLPWFLSATAKLAMTWMSETNRRALRFVQGKEIENFIARENLPDYLGGACPKDYKTIPEGSRPAVEICDQFDITVEQAHKIKELFKEYLPEGYDAVESQPRPSGEQNDENKDRHDQHNDEGQQRPSLVSGQSNNESRRSSSTSTLSAAPMVELVSKASKYMATN